MEKLSLYLSVTGSRIRLPLLLLLLLHLLLLVLFFFLLCMWLGVYFGDEASETGMRFVCLLARPFKVQV
uniref:Uncharacterized protein n=1 Tax=Physcomitrium patens TaxID=3218 RepID=A0A2K1IQG8_PHYPA|nr:hypothetical protein PHYPA_025619 [Physcomitrium patens]